MSFLKKIDKNNILVVIAVVGIAVTVGLIFVNSNQSFNLANIFGSSSDRVAKKAIDYINNNGLTSSPASLVSVSEESGLVKVKIDIGGNQFDSYVTKDGKILFPQAINMGGEEDQDTQADASNQPTDEQKQQAAATITKTDNPMLEAYVVSRCPFGIQMQRAMAEAVKAAPSLEKYIKVRYMGTVSNGKVTAMHGEEEAKENLRQICIREEQPTKYWDYVSCQMQTGDTAGCEKPTGVNSAELNACTSSASRGIAYAQEDFDLNTKYDITGSPTLILGGAGVSEFDFGGRSADAVKSIVCAGFNSEQSFCSTELNTAEAAASFSETYSSSGGTDSASCE